MDRLGYYPIFNMIKNDCDFYIQPKYLQQLRIVSPQLDRIIVTNNIFRLTSLIEGDNSPYVVFDRIDSIKDDRIDSIKDDSIKVDSIKDVLDFYIKFWKIDVEYHLSQKKIIGLDHVRTIDYLIGKIPDAHNVIINLMERAIIDHHDQLYQFLLDKYSFDESLLNYDMINLRAFEKCDHKLIDRLKSDGKLSFNTINAFNFHRLDDENNYQTDMIEHLINNGFPMIGPISYHMMEIAILKHDINLINLIKKHSNISMWDMIESMINHSLPLKLIHSGTCMMIGYCIGKVFDMIQSNIHTK